MTAAELTDWAAYEQACGPILSQDRIDIGLAQVCMVLARLFAKKSKHTIRDFLPAWWQEPAREASVQQGFEQLMKMAERGD